MTATASALPAARHEPLASAFGDLREQAQPTSVSPALATATSAGAGVTSYLGRSFEDLQRFGGRWERRQLGNLGVSAYQSLLGRRVMTTYGANGAYGYLERSRAMIALSAALDNSGVAVFTAELNALLGNPRVQAFLAELEQQLARGTRDEPTRLWEMARRHAGSHDEAMRWLAVLLQDYAPFALQGRGVVEAVRDRGQAGRLRQVLQAVASAMSAGTLAPYPPGEEQGGAAFYHYYVPAYLARRLVQRGVAPELAFLTAATFNLEYELAKPALVGERQRSVEARLRTLLRERAGITTERLEGTLAELRREQRVDVTFEVGDLGLATDLRMTPSAVRSLCSVIADEHKLAPQARELLLAAAAQPGLSTNAIVDLVNAAYVDGIRAHLVDLSLPGLIDDAAQSTSAVLRYYVRGADHPLQLRGSDLDDAYAGFAGAAQVLANRAVPWGRDELIARISESPERTMRALFAAPRNAMATHGIRSSEPPAPRDALHRTLVDFTNQRSARALIAIVDTEFNRGAPAGADLIDRDGDPTSRAMTTLHGTPLIDIATRGTPAITALPIRADFARAPAAIQLAADRGALAVVVSQEMVAADAASLALFRDVLRRNPKLMVIVAAGNGGRAVGSRPFEINALDEPNLVVVAAADINGTVSPRSNHHPRHVHFATRGGSRDDRLWQDPLSWTSNQVVSALRPNVEYSSHAAPALANLYTKVRLIAPGLTPRQALRVIAVTASRDDQTVTRVREGVPDAERAQRLAALYQLTARGLTPARALTLLSLEGRAATVALGDLHALRRSL